MNRDTREFCKQSLLEMRERLTDEVNRMVEAVPSDVSVPGGLSHVPTHLADAATEAIDKELALIRTEQGLRGAVLAALDALENGSYGRCSTCGGEIAEERLTAIPYATQCVACARSNQPS